MRRPPTLFALALLVASLSGAGASAQVQYPARAAKSDVTLRYRIAAERDARILAYRELRAYLDRLGFKEATRDDADLDKFDPAAELLTGTIPTENLPKLFGYPAILTAVARTPGQGLPADPLTPVGIRVRISTGLPAEPQQNLHAQAAAHLGLLGFREGVGYDNVGYTVVRGTIPAGNVMKLTKDLRTLPAGWFLPAVPRDMQPLPLRTTLPIRLVEVVGTPQGAMAPPPLPAPNPANSAEATPKYTPAVRTFLADAARAAGPQKFELILDGEPGDTWDRLRERLRVSAEGASVEGLVGPVVTIRLPKAADIAGVAANLEVRFVRLPSVGTGTGGLANPAGLPSVADLAAKSRVARLQALGYRGAGQHVVVVGTDFGGVLSATGKTLPAGVQLIDLPAALDPEMDPAPQPAGTGAGTVAGEVAHAVAPEARLSLVRIDPAAFHQLFNLARVVSGQLAYSEAMRTRADELNRRISTMQGRRVNVTQEYQDAFSNLGDEPRYADRRAAALKALEQLQADESTLQAALNRFGRLKGQVDSLVGATVVVNTVVWDTGFPQDGLSALSRVIETRFAVRPVRNALRALRAPAVPVWLQAAGDHPGRVWAGVFRDADGNGVMEFAPPEVSVPPNRWTRELNFFKLQTPGGEPAPMLPAGMRLRITVQWREPQDPGGYVPREPVFPMEVRLLRQIDPAGKATGSDDLAEVARTADRSVKLLRTYASGAFERTLEVTLPEAGVYCLRVEGQSAFDYAIKALQQEIEVSPRIVVETVGGDPKQGTVAFATFPGGPSGVGVPGDSLTALTIGTAARDTQQGTGPGVTLGTKPDLVAPGGVSVNGQAIRGPMASTAFMGGSLAVLGSAGVRGPDLIRHLGLTPGSDFVLPEPWLNSLGRRER